MKIFSVKSKNIIFSINMTFVFSAICNKPDFSEIIRHLAQ